MQLLAELGLVGLALLVVACVAAAARVAAALGHELALALLLPAFLVHSLVDVDWDFVAVAAPAFVAAGALVGGRRCGACAAFSLLPALGVALVVLGSLISPWLARALGEPARCGAASRNARDHACEPRARARPVPARAVLGEGATPPRRSARRIGSTCSPSQRQPKNPQPWLLAGEFAMNAGCPYAAWQHLERYTELDQKSNGPGGEEYNAMLKLVDAHKYTC